MESGLGNPEASPLSVPAARHLAACVCRAKGPATTAPRRAPPPLLLIWQELEERSDGVGISRQAGP